MGEINEKEHLVAWLDLLGFAGRLETDRIGDLVSSLQGVLQTATTSAKPVGQRVLTRDGSIVAAGPSNVEFFQDTLVVWAPEVSLVWLQQIVHTCKRLLQSLHHHGVPIRGAISVGTFFSSARGASPGPTMVLGSSVKRAHDWETVIDQAGVVIDPRLMRDPELGAFCRTLFEYPVSTKFGKRHLFTIPWTTVIDDVERHIRQMWPQPPGPNQQQAATILENTRSYLDAWQSRLEAEREAAERALAELATEEAEQPAPKAR